MSYVSEMRALIGHKRLLLAGATVLVLNGRGEILLNLRSDTGTWGIPGGCLESGESLEETAARELYEETGLRAERFTLLDVLSGPEVSFTYPNGDETESVIVLYRAEGIFGSLRINDGESIRLSYFAFDALPPLESRAEQVIRRIFPESTIRKL